jgi:hypothetical protein
MVVFWRIDMSRYALFHPLYLTGKILSVFTVLFWFFLSKNDMMKQLLGSSVALYITLGILFFLLLGDVLSALTVRIIFKESERR